MHKHAIASFSFQTTLAAKPQSPLAIYTQTTRVPIDSAVMIQSGGLAAASVPKMKYRMREHESIIRAAPAIHCCAPF